MTILITGATGKSAAPLARLLLQANKSVVLATRSGQVPAPFRGAAFDWLDASTYNNPFEVDPEIDRAYLIAPLTLDPLPPMKAFIDFAIEKGVKRFVFMSAGLIEKGGPEKGQVHQYLASLKVEYCALRPTWFFENFLTYFADGIKSNDEIMSAAEDGLIGYVSTEDIAEVAFKALVDEVIQNDNPTIVGPELVSYDQMASMLSEVLGRKIKHTRLSEAEYKVVLIQRGLPENYAKIMSEADGFIAKGAAEQLFRRADIHGKRIIREFFEANKDSWQTMN
ncbi:hypothetical protein C8J57DRAFT_1637159 [Mycena rebaudengoi]|nr:hypothetical protein C8J57DRAFT_1637159 [Mycena rebaudengoi]